MITNKSDAASCPLQACWEMLVVPSSTKQEELTKGLLALSPDECASPIRNSSGIRREYIGAKGNWMRSICQSTANSAEVQILEEDVDDFVTRHIVEVEVEIHHDTSDEHVEHLSLTWSF
jgi:hypothetical protein